MSFFPPFRRSPSEPLPVPETQVGDGTQVCVVLNDEWAAYVHGLIERLALPTRYAFDTQEEYEQIVSNVDEVLSRFTDAKDCSLTVPYKLDTILIEHREDQNVAGGAMVPGIWTILPFNHIVRDTTGLASLIANNLNLPPGMWSWQAYHYARANAAFRARMRLFAGFMDRGGVLYQAALESLNMMAYGWFDISLPGTVTLSYYSTGNRLVDGLGGPMNVAGEEEIYGQWMLQRLSLDS